jgi:hypothetical protein
LGFAFPVAQQQLAPLASPTYSPQWHYCNSTCSPQVKYVQSSHSLLVWQVMEEQSQQPKLFVAAGQEAPKLAAQENTSAKIGLLLLHRLDNRDLIIYLLHWLGLRLGLARLEGLSVHDLLRHSLQRSLLLLLLLLLKLHHHLLLLLLQL